MRWVVLCFIVACGKSEPTTSGTGTNSGGSKPAADAAPVAVDAAPVVVDAAVAIDAAAAVMDPPPPAVKTGIEFVAFEGFKEEKLGNIEKIWTGWIKDHFEKCESDEAVDEVTTTATITFKGEEITFDMAKLPAKLAACVEQKIRTPYLGYQPTPPDGVPPKLKVKIKIGEKAPPEPPDNSPVVYVASKVKGARPKAELTKWLDKNVARKLKPCIEETPVAQDLWKISFEMNAGGKMTKAAAPGDQHVATCVQKILDGLTAPKGPGANTVELVYMAKR